MKKIYSSAIALAACLSMSAQQLPNDGFEGEWVESTPWNTISGTQLSMTEALERMNFDPETPVAPVLQPKGWIISNVLGVVQVLDEEDGGGFGALGSTVVGYKAEGCNSATAVKLVNNPNPFMATQIVPAYISFGTSWATNGLDFTTFTPIDKDGGVFGGLEFTQRPDALTFDYKLEAPEEGDGQKATVLVYAWKGSWSQADVPGNNTMMPPTTTTTMVDRDRNILGMETPQGGEVTHSDDAELIAKSLEYITEFTSDWKSYELPVEYLSEAAPAMINVVLAANDYFDSENIVSGNALTVDNVKFAYYSRLKSLSIAGVAVPGFDSNVYSYDLSDTDMPEESAIVAEPMANAASAKVEITLDKAAATATIKVSNLNEGGLDVDGEATHEYVIKFRQGGEVSAAYGGEYVGEVSISLGDEPAIVPGTVIITPNADNAAKCTFTLPNFSLSEETNLGDIVVPDVVVTATADGFSFVGAVKGLKLNMNGTDIYANVNLDGTVSSEGVATMNIPVIWLMDPVNDPEGLAGIPIDVKFNGKLKSTGISAVEAEQADAPAEYFNLNGVRVAADYLTPGLYIKRQGGKTQKVYVK